MAKAIVVLTAAELLALGAIDGTLEQPPIAAKIKERLLKLFMIERREWPNGPYWRTLAGDRWLKKVRK